MGNWQSSRVVFSSRDDWRAYRRERVTSTDVALLMGDRKAEEYARKYGVRGADDDPVETLWLQKIGELPDVDENIAMKVGIACEELLACDEYGQWCCVDGQDVEKVWKDSVANKEWICYRHVNDECLCASIDYLASVSSGIGIVEVKTTRMYLHQTKDRDYSIEVLDYWNWQKQAQMEVLRMGVCDTVALQLMKMQVYVPEVEINDRGGDICPEYFIVHRGFRSKRDREIGGRILEVSREFYKCIKDRERPDSDWLDKVRAGF